MNIVPDTIFAQSLVLGLCFFILYKSANLLVNGAVSIAYQLKIPKLVIGIILVGFATTAPEFTVSLLSALRGYPEIALGNAVGSVIVDDGLALGLGILVAPAAIRVEKKSIRVFGLFLITIDIIAFSLSLNGIISRWEGLILILILVGYLVLVFLTENRKRKSKENYDPELESHVKSGGIPAQFLLFFAGVAGVILASEFLINSALFFAGYFGASKAVIGLTVVAIGTSLPEIATCIVAARRGHGDLALGDILGADILNVLWIIGAAALANPIRVERSVILFAFPWMLVMVGVMLLLACLKYRLKRWKGIVLIGMYMIYLIHTIMRFYSHGLGEPLSVSSLF